MPLDNHDKSSFGLPSDYFSSFEDKLRKKIELQHELTDYPLLCSVTKNNVFNVPENYFSESENALELKSELSAYSKLQNMKPLVQSDLDVEYIKQFKVAISHKIELVEELKDYKTLYQLDKINSFMVSDTYFESIAERVKDKVYAHQTSSGSVLSKIFDVVFGKRMAFAFGLVAIVSLSVYFYNATEPIIESGDCKTLACLERQEILNNAKAISDFDEDQLMDLVDVNSLNKQLNTVKEKGNTINKETLNLDSTSDDELLEEL